MSHMVALGDMFLHHNEHTHTHCRLFWLNPTHTVLLPQILTRAQNVDLSTAENCLQQMPYFYLYFNTLNIF